MWRSNRRPKFGGAQFLMLHKLNQVYFNKLLERYSLAQAAKENAHQRLNASEVTIYSTNILAGT